MLFWVILFLFGAIENLNENDRKIVDLEIAYCGL